ncbi:hypothetical protein SmJEL517_g03625 [Synchytrium microbalum]|uniref:protein xylosyltransferase n=1 Tax=Synchytrium microbalum TaxID=1806994 RepID=A0A507C3A7_9FUNG|nr:uncharacterized protein SmJEL517_g03625 [Synchytrium microbalum]TPX33529.1 hypothetical protein SmJEL517_g03625 [Synchytrium microbalum]
MVAARSKTRIWLIRHTSCLRYTIIVFLSFLVLVSLWLTRHHQLSILPINNINHNIAARQVVGQDVVSSTENTNTDDHTRRHIIPLRDPAVPVPDNPLGQATQDKQIDLVLKMPNNDDSTIPRDDPIFHPDLSRALTSVDQVALTGFKFCPWLEGATVSPWVHIQPLGGNLFQMNPSRTHLASMVDALAKIVAQNVVSWSQRGIPSTESIQRFSCRMAIDGTNEWALLADAKWLQHVNSANYFPEMSFGSTSLLSIVSSPRSNTTINTDNSSNEDRDTASSEQSTELTKVMPSPRPKYKMAYLIMIHEHPDALATLLKALHTPSTLILIHLDKGASELRPAVEQVIAQVPEYYNNVYVFSQFNIHWGGGSMVMMMIEGFLKLLDLGDWDYVVNLSGYDYPLLEGEAIHSILERDPGKIYLTHWQDSETPRRLELVFLAGADQKFVVRPSAGPDRSFPYKNKFTPIKHHQWLILPRDFISYLRTSQEAIDLLSWAEHAWVPDEWYFGMVIMASPYWRDRIHTRCGRYINFPHGALHPNWIERRDLSKIARAGIGSYFFARKVWIVGDEKVVKWLDRWRERGSALVASGNWVGSIAGEPMMSANEGVSVNSDGTGVNDNVDVLSDEWWESTASSFVVNNNQTSALT